MKVNDRVRHKRLGVGVVRALYPKINGARVEFESGHKTTCSISRLQVLTAGQGSLSDQERVVSQPRRSGRKDGVNYDELERVRQKIAARHPDADEVVARIYGNRYYCEIWHGGSAKIEFYEDD